MSVIHKENLEVVVCLEEELKMVGVVAQDLVEH